MKAEVLERLLISPGTPKDLGSKIWCLINGIDNTVSFFVRSIAIVWLVFKSQGKPLESSPPKAYLEASSLSGNGNPDSEFR